MSPLPLAVRIAAGLAATAVERARKLPQDLAELPITAVSRAMQVSMRVQQQITELAIKGDNAIALLRTPAEEPPWAVFDEDVEDRAYRLPEDRTGAAQEAARDWYEAEYAATAAAADTAGLAEGPADLAESTADLGESSVPASDLTGALSAETDDTTARTDDTTAVADDTTAVADDTAALADDTPRALPAYGRLSLASVRGRLRAFDADELQELLDYEVAHANRPEFVRMLTNRISAVRSR